MDDAIDMVEAPDRIVTTVTRDGHPTLTPQVLNVVRGQLRRSQEGGLFHKSMRWADMTLLHPHVHGLRIPQVNLPILRSIRYGKYGWDASRSFGGLDLTPVPGQVSWIRYMLVREKKKLHDLGIYFPVFLSLFKYEHNEAALRAFASRWCYITNTLFLEDREMAPNLLEISYLTGLPIAGSPYDERDFTVDDIIFRPVDGVHEHHKYLRHIYRIYWYLLAGRESLTLAEWVNYFTSAAKNKGTLVADISDPFGDQMPSTNIDRRARHRDRLCSFSHSSEVLLIAFIAWWICYFVVPSDRPDILRPSVFYMAYRMVMGEKFSLAVPALAFLYSSLRILTTAENMSAVAHNTPLHLLSGWMSLHWSSMYTWGGPDVLLREAPFLIQVAGGTLSPGLTEIEAQRFFRSCATTLRTSRACRFSKAYSNGLREIYDIPQINLREDDVKAYEYLVSIRQNFLPLHYGDRYILEHYNTNRGVWQYGYDQETPTELPSLQDVTLDAATFDQYWNPLLEYCTGKHFLIPAKNSPPPKFGWYYQKEHLNSVGNLLSFLPLEDLVGHVNSMTGLSSHTHKIPPSAERPSGFVGFDSFYRWSDTGASLHGLFTRGPVLRPFSLVPRIPDYNVIDEDEEPAWTPPHITAPAPRQSVTGSSRNTYQETANQGQREARRATTPAVRIRRNPWVERLRAQQREELERYEREADPPYWTGDSNTGVPFLDAVLGNSSSGPFYHHPLGHRF